MARSPAGGSGSGASDRVSRGPSETAGAEGSGATEASSSPAGVSPYASGGGGVTFERKVAVQYLAHLLAGDGASELGDGRRILSVEFQRAPEHPVDDIVVTAARPDEPLPSLVLALAVRRSPKVVPSDKETRKLIRQFVRAVVEGPADGREQRLGLVVAGPQLHARQLGVLAEHAADQMDAPGFFDLVRTPRKFNAGVRGRLCQLEQLVRRALREVGAAETDAALVQQRTWELLSILTVLMPRLESPDETDWFGVVNSLIPLARGSDLTGASGLRDRLLALAGDYSPRAARVDLTLLRRHAHGSLDTAVRRNQAGWQLLDHLHERALESVRNKIAAADGARRLSLDRSGPAAQLVAAAEKAGAVVVTGESGVGKSALGLLSLTSAGTANPDTLQVLCVNLRQVPRLTVDFEARLGSPLWTLLGELSAPRRVLVVDGADAVSEGMDEAFRFLLDAAKRSGVKVVAVTSVVSKQIVVAALVARFGDDVSEHPVAPLTDTEVDEIVETFPELNKLGSNPRSRGLLRRLVVVDLLVRASVSGVPLTDADAMNEVWAGLVRRRERSDMGSPDARELALLRLADLKLRGGDPLDVIGGLDSAALDGLRRDGLLRTSSRDPFKVGPEFAHDEVQGYAVARLLLSHDTPASRLLQAGAPRWSLSAAQLACAAWLGRPETAMAPLRGRFGELQASFDALAEAGHGDRWGDLPGEALLALAAPEPVLRDALPRLRADDGAGLNRLARLVEQRLSDDNGFVNVVAAEPVIASFLGDELPWQSFDRAPTLLREWLRGHVVANTPEGHRLRILLRERLVEACAAGDRRLAEKQAAAAEARAARTPAEIEAERRFEEENPLLFTAIGHGGQGHRHRRRRQQVPREITDKIVLELLALVGPDLGEDGEAILLRVAEDAPSRLAPALEKFLADYALAGYRPGLLARLTEAYYLDEEADDIDTFDDGVRRHDPTSMGFTLAASWGGPFMALFRSDFRNGVAVLNRLLNHAARVRARRLSSPHQDSGRDEAKAAGQFESELAISGARKLYIGDEQVWFWYRGTGVGPYPCLSALQALELVCDELTKGGVPLRTLVSILLRGCQSLAMVSFVVGLLVRHLEDADHLLDRYFTEPLIWHLEHLRVGHETSPLAAASEDVVAPERRKWSLCEAAMFAVLRADQDRAAELHALGETLVLNARRRFESTRDAEPTEADPDAGDFIEQQLARVRVWATCLDRDSYQFQEAADGVCIRARPGEDVARVLQPSRDDRERFLEAIQLDARHRAQLGKKCSDAADPDQLATDIGTARELLRNPPSLNAHQPWDTPALVAAAALETEFVHGMSLSSEALSFAADTLLRIGEGAAWPRHYESEVTAYSEGADRSAARALPLLLLPAAAPLRAGLDEADGWTTFDRVTCAGVKLAEAVADEVRLYLARGLDHVWEAPCSEEGRCHHEVGLRLATETLRYSVLGDWNPGTGRRNVLALEEPMADSLAESDDAAIIVSRLNAAIRALAPAAAARICVSTHAGDLLRTVLVAHRRSLLCPGLGWHTHQRQHALVGARALLTLAEGGDDTAIFTHIDAYAQSAALLSEFLQALSAAAEETDRRAATARRVWSNIVRHVLKLNGLVEHGPFQDSHHGDLALAALVPNPAGESFLLYWELDDGPIVWWKPLRMKPEIELWLAVAEGRSECVDQLISFLRVLEPEDQVQTGLPWVARLVLAEPSRIAGRSYFLSDWLIGMRHAAEEAGLLPSWQEVVDALVVAGVTKLAPYSV